MTDYSVIFFYWFLLKIFRRILKKKGERKWTKTKSRLRKYYLEETDDNGWALYAEKEESFDDKNLFFQACYRNGDEMFYTVVDESVLDYEIKMETGTISDAEEDKYNTIMSRNLCALFTDDGLMGSVPKYNSQYQELEKAIIEMASEYKLKIRGLPDLFQFFFLCHNDQNFFSSNCLNEAFPFPVYFSFRA